MRMALAMVEAADLVVAGKHKEVVQDESKASYEGWFRANEARINWFNAASNYNQVVTEAADAADGLDLVSVMKAGQAIAVPANATITNAALVTTPAVVRIPCAIAFGKPNALALNACRWIGL